MKSKIAAFVAGVFLLLAPIGARAATYNINLNTAPGVPGTAGSATWIGPRYCYNSVTYSAIYSVVPGSTVDFGTVTTHSFGPIGTPDLAR